MPLSSYQVEWLIHQRRRWLGLVRMVERRGISSIEKVELSEEGSRLAAAVVRKQVPRSEPAGPLHLADRNVYPPPVALELERRAGGFMQPRVSPELRPIPKVKRRDPEAL